MKQHSLQLRGPGLLAAAFAAVLTALICACALPTAALADEDTSTTYNCAQVGSKSFDNQHLQDAVDEAANSGATLVMTGDWDLGDKLYVPEGKKVTVDMDGHRIDASKCQVFSVHEKGELVLTSSKKNTFTYRGYSNEDGKEYDYTVTTGGLITGKSGSINTIRARSNATITLDGVTIGGSDCWSDAIPEDNSDSGQGAVSLASHATLNMKNGASIEHCQASNGVGVHATGQWATINMDASSISNNWGSSWGHGGGVYAFYNTTIKMTNGSHVDNNHSGAGGGIYFAGTNNTLTGDGTGTVSGNQAVHSSETSGKTAQCGGGIHVAETTSKKTDSSLIENVTIANNYSAYDGGGLELDHANTKIKNCTIKDNWCKYEGGGAYVCDDGNTFENCTITGNSCSVDSGGNYEGGGIYVWHSYDVVLNGVCVIKGNTRGKGTSNPDDVFLREDFWTSTKAYIIGNLSEGSSVGIRTGYTKDRRVAKNFKCDTKDCFFADLDGYYVSYGTDEGGDAWQRHATREFSASLDGVEKGRYKQGTAATLVAPTFKDNLIFWRWDTDLTRGLNPIEDYISGAGLRSNVLNFTMPQNDVYARTYYTTRAEEAKVLIDAPVAGEALPVTAKVRRNDNNIGGNDWATASVIWYEVDGDTRTQVSGTAKPGTVYAATITCASDPSIPLYFENQFTWAQVRVAANDSDKGSYPSIASVDSTTGALTVVTNNFDKTDGEKTDVTTKTEKATVKMENGGLEAGVAGGASEAAVVALSDDGADAQAESDTAEFGEFDVSWTEGDQNVVIVAPAKAGYNFCNWKNARDWEFDDALGTVTVPYDEVGYIDELVAVYTPAVTRVEVEMDEPAPAAGAKLATSVKALVLTGSDGSTLDLVEAIDAGDRPVTWSPESEDGLADYSTAYTALVELADGEGLEGVEKVLASGAEVVVTSASGATEVEAAGFTVVDGKLCLAVSFPSTRAVKAVSVEQPADVEVSFEDAAAGNWSLPKTVDIQLENDETAEGDVTWEAVEGFNANATEAQELRVKGKITHIAYDGELDADDLDLNVTVTVKVAAPAQAEGDNADSPSNADSKPAFAKTGDATLGFALFAIAAMTLATAAIAGGVVALRRGRN